MKTLAAVLALMTVSVLPAHADQAEDIVHQANVATMHTLSTAENNWLVAHYGHDRQTLDWARVLVQFGIMHAEGTVAWEPRIVALEFQQLTRNGERLIELVRQLLGQRHPTPIPTAPCPTPAPCPAPCQQSVVVNNYVYCSTPAPQQPRFGAQVVHTRTAGADVGIGWFGGRSRPTRFCKPPFPDPPIIPPPVPPAPPAP